jgi:hypothetical protein
MENASGQDLQECPQKLNLALWKTILSNVSKYSMGISTKLSIEYSFMHFYYFPVKYYAKWRFSTNRCFEAQESTIHNKTTIR